MKTTRMLVILVLALALAAVSLAAEDTWTRKANMPTTGYALSTSVVGSKIYAIGGSRRRTRTDEYDPATDTWTNKADIPTDRGFPSTSVVNGKIYVIGGTKSQQPISIVEVYDPTTDTWAKQTELPTRRMWLSTSVVDGIIYVIGGLGGSQGEGAPHLATVEAYDPATDTWTPKADMPTGRSLLSTCVVDGIIYAIGGWNRATAAVEAYDPTTDTWMRKAPMPTARYLLGTSVVGGRIYAIGGWRHSAQGPLYSTVEVYDPATDTWTKEGDIPVPTAGLSTSVVDGKIYAIGGALTTHNGNFVHTSAVYEYEPVPPPPDFNGDFKIDIEDLIILIEHWGQDEPSVDIAPPPSGDGIVDVQDLEVFMSYWGQEIDDPRLVAHWKLDETEGDIAYDSVAANDAVVIGDAIWQPTGGQVAGALEFDGMDDYVSTEFVLNPADGPFSVFAWIKDGAPGQVVISQADGADWLCADSLEGNLMTELQVTARSSLPLMSESVITDGQWHRVGFVWDGTNRTLYVDDIEVAKDTQPGLGSSDRGLYFGAGNTLEPANFFSGLIDDVRIYNRAITP